MSRNERAIAIDYLKPANLLFLETIFHIIDASHSLDVLLDNWPPSAGLQVSWSKDFSGAVPDVLPFSGAWTYASAFSKYPVYHPSHSQATETHQDSLKPALSQWYGLRSRGSTLQLRVRGLSVDVIGSVYGQSHGASADQSSMQLRVNEYIAAWLASSERDFSPGDPRSALKTDALMDTVENDQTEAPALMFSAIRFDVGFVFREWQRIINGADDSTLMEELMQALLGAWSMHDMYLNRLVHGRAFFCTQHGLVGLGPGSMRVGDSVATPFGASVPFILRPTRGGLKVVGDAYVHGIMQGEMVRLHDEQPDVVPVEEFVLI